MIHVMVHGVCVKSKVGAFLQPVIHTTNVSESFVRTSQSEIFRSSLLDPNEEKQRWN